MKIYGSALPFAFPARTYIIDGSVAQPEALFVEALQKAKFRISSKHGEQPIVARYGTPLKWIAGSSAITMLLPEKLQRWELSIQALISVERDERGHHAVTVIGQAIPTRGNDYLFDVGGKAAEAHAQAGQLLHVTDFFQGDPKAMRKRGKAPK